MAHPGGVKAWAASSVAASSVAGQVRRGPRPPVLPARAADHDPRPGRQAVQQTGRRGLRYLGPHEHRGRADGADRVGQGLPGYPAAELAHVHALAGQFRVQRVYGSTCCSSSAQARMTGRTARAGGARVMIACRVVSSEPDNMCSTEPCPATAGSRRPSSRSAGTARPPQAAMTPCRAKASPRMEHSSGASRLTAARISSSARSGSPPRRCAPVAGCERGQPGGLGRGYAGRHQGPHGPQPDQVRRGVPAVPACGAAGWADSGPAFPGPQGRGGNAESPGSATHREHRLGRRGAAAVTIRRSSLRELRGSHYRKIRAWPAGARIRRSSSPKLTSNCQCNLFSMPQWPRM